MKLSKYFVAGFVVALISSGSSAKDGVRACQSESQASPVAKTSGGCLLGATIGTFIFPGIGTVAGCAAVSAVTVAWIKKMGGGNDDHCG